MGAQAGLWPSGFGSLSVCLSGRRHPIPSWGARVLSAAPDRSSAARVLSAAPCLASRGQVLPIGLLGSAVSVSRGTAAHSAALPRQSRRLTMRAKSPSAEPASRCNGFSSCFLARPAGSRADREAPPPFSSWPLRLRWHPPVFCAAFQDLLLGNPKASRALRRHTGKGGPGAQSEGNCYYSLPPPPQG